MRILMDIRREREAPGPVARHSTDHGTLAEKRELPRIHYPILCTSRNHLDGFINLAFHTVDSYL